MHAPYVTMWLGIILYSVARLYGVHRTCDEVALVSRGTSHVTTKQRCKHTTLVDIENALCKATAIQSGMQQERSG